ncbi:MAG: ABC transporter substrate-binding protein [Pseudomonadota bacterium]
MFRVWIAATVALCSFASGATADLKLAGLTYRSGPYAVAGIPFSDGFADYLTLLNERDGGINGQRIELLECEFGYSTEKGVECYDELTPQGVLAYQPLSTGLTYALVERAAADGVVLHTMGYGITAASDGERFPYVFNFPAHYWDAATAQIRYLKELNDGDLAGKTIMHLHHNSGYGREPVPTFERLAAREGFELKLMPIDHPGENQDEIWEAIDAERPDYILLWGWGVMNEVALKGARKIRYPLENVFGVWWSAAESDVRGLGRAANGYRAVTFHAVGTDFRIYNEMNELVYFAGKARGEMNNLGEVLYNRGVASAIYTTEAIRLAMEIHGTNDVTRDMVRDGFEQLEFDDEDYERLGIEGFTPPLRITCADHGGGGLVAVKEWNAVARRWEQITDYYPPEADLIEPQVEAAAAAFTEGKSMRSQSCG